MPTLDDAILGGATRDPLDAAIDNDKRRQALIGAVGQNPDEYGKAVQLGRTTGVPAPVVARNLPDVEGRAKIDALDAAIMPGSAVDRSMQNPDFAKLTHDDVPNVNEIEALFNPRMSAGKIGGPAFRRPSGSMTAGPEPGFVETLRDSFRRGIPGLKSTIPSITAADSLAALNQLDYVDRTIAAGGKVDTSELGVIAEQYYNTPPEQRAAFRKRYTPAITDRALASLAGVAENQKAIDKLPAPPSVVQKVSNAETFGEGFNLIAQDPVRYIAGIGPESLVQSAPGLALALPAGLAGGAAGAAAAIGTNSFVTDYASSLISEMTRAGINVQDPNAVRAALKDPQLLNQIITDAGAHATVVGAFDAASGGLASRTLVPAAIARKLAGRPLAKELANIALQAPVQGALGAAGEAGGSFAAGNAIQPGDVLAEAFGEFFGTPGEVLSASAGHLRERFSAEQAARDAEAIAALSRLSATSKLRPRDVQSFEQFVQTANADSPVQDLYLDVRALQQAGVDPAALAAISPTAAAQMPEALATGGDLVIPVSEYAGRIAGTELDPVLLQHLRTSEDAMSVAGAQQFQEEQARMYQEQAAKVMDEKIADERFQTSAKAVETKLFDELKNTGRFTDDVNTAYSTLMRDFYVTTAARLGITPEEMYARYPLQVRAESVAADAKLDQGRYTKEQIEAQNLDEREAMLRETGGVMPRWLPAHLNSDAYTQQNGEFAFNEEADAARYAKGLELGEGGAWGVQQLGGRWRAKRLPNVANAKDSGYSADNTLAQGAQDANSLDFTGSRTGADRPGVQADQNLLPTVAGGNAREGWADATRVRGTNGKPAVVYRGATRPLAGADFERSALGAATGNPSSGLGVWFTPHREEAGRYGDVEQFHLDLRNPKVIRVEDLPGFDTVEEANAFARELAAQGYDGIAVDARHLGGPVHFVAFTPNEVIYPPPPAALDMGQFFQGGQGETVPQTETPEFKRWFGDSKVVDADGKPLVVYHGTNADFTEFAPEMQGTSGQGSGEPAFYFDANPGNASSYVRNSREGGKVVPVYLSLKNPLIVDRTNEKHGYDGSFDRVAFANFVDDALENGNDGVIFRDVLDRGKRSTQYAVFEPTQIKSAIGNRGAFDPNDPNILNQPQAGQGGARAEMSFGRDITQTPTVITLFAKADLSSFLHEMGHFQLEVLANIASRPDAPQGIVDDMNAALKWFNEGMTVEQWNAMSIEEKRPYHEQFARGFEAYLFEGKAPNQELQSLFQRFRAWMLNVYKSVLALNVEINDDIRRVFDRLLASEETIKAAEAARAYTPLFTSPEEMGTTPQEWADYERLGLEASRDAQDELQRRSLKDMQWLTNARGRILKELQKDAKEKRKAVEEEVRAEVKAMPVYAAMHFLKRGEMTAPNGEQIKVEKGAKLDTAALAEMYPETMLARPDLGGLRGMTRKDGLHPDLVAEMFGYDSGDQLVREILAAEPEDELVKGLSDQRVLERYGDLANPDTLARAADEAIHNEARARFVATEVKALSKATTPVRVMTKAAKSFAETMIARKKVKDIKPAQYAAAETRAAKNAEKARKAGDSATAAAEKRSQLVQNYATRAAYDAVDEVEKGVKYLRKVGDSKTIDADYKDQIDALLERFDLRASVTNKEAAKRASLLAWVESQREQGFEPDIPPELLSEAMRKPYREMTLEEFRGLVDTVKQVEHLGRLKQKLLTAKDEREFAAVVSEITTSIEANANGRTAETRTPTDALGKLAKSLRRFWASHIKAATWSRVMDGGKDGGPMWEYFIRSANEKGDMETQMRAEATKALSAILGPVVKQWPKLQGKGQYFPTVGRAFTREGAMTVALNTGNAGNLQRLLGGEGWTFEQIRPVLESLTTQEWEAVQAVWDHFETYKPQIGAKERRIYGKEPNWVEPTPFTIRTADGAEVPVRGGYYPIKYDPAASQRAEEHADAEQAARDMRGAYTAATTRRSFTKARAEEVTGRPLLYSFVGVYSGVNDVIHDLAWHEWLIDANRLLRSRNIDQAIRGHYGPEVKDQFKQWVKDVAQGETRADHPGEQSVAWLRQSVSAAGLGFNVMSAAMQVTGFSSSIVRVGAGYIGRGVTQYVASPIATTREVNAKSSFMESRSRTQFRELNELRNQVEGQTKAGRALTLGTYFLMMRAQRMVDVPTWLGAYEKAIAEGNNEERSIALADQAVIDSQGSGMIKDLSTVERGGQALKLFTVFYNYMNTTLNVGAAVAMTERNKAKLAAKMLMTFTAPAVLGYAIRAALTPGGDDEPDDIIRKLLAEQISFLTGLMVGVREFSEVGKIMAGAEGVRDYAGPAGVRVVGDAVKAAQQAKQGEFDDAFRRASINLLGDLTGLPAAQINRTINGIEALDEDKTDNPAAAVLGYQR